MSARIMRATDERARDSRNRQSEILVSRLTKKLTSSPVLELHSKSQGYRLHRLPGPGSFSLPPTLPSTFYYIFVLKCYELTTSSLHVTFTCHHHVDT